MGGCYSERRLWCVWLSGEPCVPVARARLVLHGRAQAENVEGHHPRTQLKWQDLGHFNDFFSMNPFLTATSYWPIRSVQVSVLARPGFRGTSAQAWPGSRGEGRRAGARAQCACRPLSPGLLILTCCFCKYRHVRLLPLLCLPG